MSFPRPDLAALGLCGLIVCAISGLAVTGHPVPDVLPYLATAALSAGAGLSLNTPNPPETIRTSTPPAARTVTAPAPAPAPVPVPAQPVAATAAVRASS